MTEVATTLRSCYLAGPMRGHPEFNFPEFHKQAAWLRAGGWQVFSPAERDEADEALNGDWAIGQERGLDYFMQFDLAAVCQTDAVIVMSGWERSQGARLEAVTATEIDHPVFEIDVRDDGFRLLKSVDPEYIRDVFFAPEFAEAFQKGTVFRDVDGEPVHIAAGPEGMRQFDTGATRNVETGPDEVKVVGPEEWTGAWSPNEKGEYLAIPTAEYDPSLAEARKAMPIATGVLDYFPAALLEVAKVSKAGNDKHNPGQPLHHARGKSMNHADSLLRHLIERGGVDPETGMLHSAEMAWRALALLQQELEDAGAPLARAAVLPES